MPEVVDSRILSHNGNDYRMYMRLFKKKVITVVLDTEHDVRYFQLDPSRWYSRSYTTKISEVEDAGKPSERQLPPGDDHGFMWRLYSYWKFQERRWRGLRRMPGGFALARHSGRPGMADWSDCRQLPKQSLENTLDSTRKAVLVRQPPHGNRGRAAPLKVARERLTLWRAGRARAQSRFTSGAVR